MTTNDKKPDPWTSKADNGSNSTTIAIIVAALVLVVGAFIFFGSTTTTPDGRYCCKSLFASLNTSFPGRGCGALTTMWGTTLLGAKLTGDLGNAPEGTSTSDYCLFPPLAGNLSFGILGLLQQYRPSADIY